jgi:hypothetical protein
MTDAGRRRPSGRDALDTPPSPRGSAPRMDWLGWGSLGVLLAWLTWAALRMIPPQLWRQGFRAQHLAANYNSWSFPSMAYSDVLWLYHVHVLGLHLLPYIANPIEYPVIMGWFMYAMSWLPGVLAYFVGSMVVLAAAAVVSFFMLRRVAPRTYWAWAVSPLWLPYAFLNWDLLGIVALVAAWWCFERERWTWSGVWIGVGVAVKFFPIAMWPFMAAALWARGRQADAWRLTVATAVPIVVLNAPMAVANFKNWSWFYTYNAGRPVGGDIWVFILPHLSHLASTVAVDGLSFMLLGAVSVLALLSTLRGEDPRRAAAVTFLVWMVVNKVFSPQYMVWVLTMVTIAEWPVWTAAAVTLGGLSDWWNSFGVLGYSQRFLHPLFLPYRPALYSWLLRFRYVTLLAATAAGAVVLWARRGPERQKAAAP